MRRASRLTAALLWGALLFTGTAVPLLDVGLYELGAVLQPEGQRQGEHRDHDHRICTQVFANASILAAPLNLLVRPLEGSLLESAGESAYAVRLVPPASARDPPAL